MTLDQPLIFKIPLFSFHKNTFNLSFIDHQYALNFISTFLAQHSNSRKRYMCIVDLAQLLRLMYEASIFTRSLFLFIHDGFRDKFHLKFADLSRVHVIFAFNPLQGYCTTDWFAVSDKTIINLSRKISIMSHFLLHFKSHSFQYYISLVALFHFILTFSAILRLQCFIFHHLQPFITLNFNLVQLSNTLDPSFWSRRFWRRSNLLEQILVTFTLLWHFSSLFLCQFQPQATSALGIFSAQSVEIQHFVYLTFSFYFLSRLLAIFL